MIENNKFMALDKDFMLTLNNLDKIKCIITTVLIYPIFLISKYIIKKNK